MKPYDALRKQPFAPGKWTTSECFLPLEVTVFDITGASANIGIDYVGDQPVDRTYTVIDLKEIGEFFLALAEQLSK